MGLEDDVVMEDVERVKYDFAGVVHGKSQWARTNNERISIMQAFARYEAKAQTGLKATSRAVGMNDPKGDGYRVWFLAEKVEIKPAVASKLPKWDTLDIYQQTRLRISGVVGDEGIADAVASIGPAPKTITEANEARKLVLTLKTPLQLRVLETVNLNTVSDADQAAADRAARDRAERKFTWVDGDPSLRVVPAFGDLTAEQLREMRVEARISTAEEYERAWRREATTRPGKDPLYAVINGYSEFTRWKVTQGLEAQP